MERGYCIAEDRKAIKNKKRRKRCFLLVLGYGLENIDRDRAKPSKHHNHYAILSESTQILSTAGNRHQKRKSPGEDGISQGAFPRPRRTGVVILMQCHYFELKQGGGDNSGRVRLFSYSRE